MVQSVLGSRLDPRFREEDTHRLSNWLKQATAAPGGAYPHLSDRPIRSFPTEALA